MDQLINQNGIFKFSHLGELLDNHYYEASQLSGELNELVRRNFLAYDPVTAEYTVQGKSMEIGLAMYVELSKTYE